MLLITHQSHIDQLPPSPLRSHIAARYQSLVETEEDNPVIFIIVEEEDNITDSDYAFVSEDNGLLGDGDISSPQYYRPYENVSYLPLPGLNIYESLLLVNGEDGYWILIPEDIVEAHPDLKYVLTAPELGGLSNPQPI